MGLGHSPTIITDGLVFSLDAANTRSYSGTGLTAFGLISGIDGTLVNGVGFTTSNRGSFIFDGTNDYILFSSRTTNMEFQYTSAFTIMSFCRITENSGEGYVINNRTTDANGNPYTGWGILNNNGSLLCIVGGYPNANTLSWRRVSTTGTAYNDLIYNRWAHITYINTGDAGGQKIYINGLDYTSSASDDTNPPYTINYSGGNHRIYVGYDGTGTHPISANIAQVQIFNKALSATEIKQNYNATKRRFGL
jgi:hypothetical protein